MLPYLERPVAIAALLIALAVALVFLVRRSRDQSSRINLDELLLDEVTGKTSKTAAVLFGSFVVTSWVIVFQTSKGTLSDASFAAYCGFWVVPAVSKIIWAKASPEKNDA